jgi:hypothetical protein
MLLQSSHSMLSHRSLQLPDNSGVIICASATRFPQSGLVQPALCEALHNAGKLGFYLEALDRDVRKPHEQPAIGVLLCATKDDEVVEYTLSRTLSPALIAEYQTQLPDKKLLQEKLHEFYLQNAPEER